MIINLILASCYPQNGIGANNSLPWSLKHDMARFKALTTRSKKSAVIMGRKTWESMNERALPNRLNIVMTTKMSHTTDIKGVLFVPNFDIAIANVPAEHEIWVIGGARVYEEAAAWPCATVIIHHTEIYARYDALDTFYEIKTSEKTALADPAVGCANFRMTRATDLEWESDTKTKKQTWFRHFEWVRMPTNAYNTTCDSEYLARQLLVEAPCMNREEQQCLDLLRKIRYEGKLRGDRTGTGTRSIFGPQMRFNLRTGFPCITTKKLFLKGVFMEVLWKLSGKTDAKWLSERGVHIWDANTSREFLDKNGLQHFEVGDIGATYGFSFRHYGAKYRGCAADYKGEGVDQLAEVIRQLREEPESRRIIIELWNSSALEECALPPCVKQYQFYVADGELSCIIYCRSQDLFLGTSFNICEGALVTHILANIAGLKVGDLIWDAGDAHMYMNHFEQVEEQIERQPFPKPILQLPINSDGSERKLELADIDDDKIAWSDFQLIGYRAHPAIKADMAV